MYPWGLITAVTESGSRRRCPWEVAFAAAVSVSILVAPRGLAYDWVLLAIPLGLVWTRLPDLWRTWLWLTAALVIATPMSILMTKWQMDEFGIALQIAPVVLCMVLIIAGRSIVRDLSARPTYPSVDATTPQATGLGAAQAVGDTINPAEA
jgi:hypothetical protein